MTQDPAIADHDPSRAWLDRTLDSEDRAGLRQALWQLLLVTALVQGRFATRLGMSTVDVEVMQQLAGSDEQLGPAELARRLSVTSAATTQSAARLIAAGHLERTDHPSDRRRHVLSVTAGGMDHVMTELGPLLRRLEAAAEPMSEDDRAVVRGYLDRVTDAYRDHLGEDPPPPPR